MPLTGTARSELSRIVGEENFMEGAAASAYAIWGRAPSVVVFPLDINQAAACSDLFHQYSLSVVPWGGGARIEQGGSPAGYDVALATSRMGRLLDFSPADLMIAVEGGMTLSKLQSILHSEGLRLPLDPPLPDRSTIGGIASTRDTGGLRHAFGGPRDFVTGVRVADPEGQIVKGGSKVVKNVAGYDLPKLYVGSWGTLGLLCELTFRVLPLPEETALARIGVDRPERVEDLLAAIMDSDLLPSSLDFLNEAAANTLLSGPPDGWNVLVLFEGAREDVGWEMERLQEAAESVGGSFTAIPKPADRVTMTASNGEQTGVMPTAGDAAATAHEEIMGVLADYPLANPPGWRMTVKAGLLGSRAAALSAAMEAIAERRRHTASIVARAGGVVLQAHLIASSPTPGDGKSSLDETAELLNELRVAANEAEASITVERAVPGLRERIVAWPPAGDGEEIMKRIKKSMDPANLWNPGRFIV